MMIKVVIALCQLDYWCQLINSSISEGIRSLLNQSHDRFWSLPFSVATQCDSQSCPGSAYNLITAAWANIGYMAHSDFIHLLTGTGFQAWGPLIYVIAAIGGLISVALNNPPRNYAWFFIGPGIYLFLVETTVDVRGVSWRVAGEDQEMSEVWKHAEAGLANTSVVARRGISVDKNGPQGQYPVAMPLVFLDGLFSQTADGLIQFVGIGNQRGQGSADSNLAKDSGNGGTGPWHKLANLKWGMVENIVGATARNPDVRDALITFLASECGAHFKRGIDDGRYISAAQSKGQVLPKSVLRDGPEGDYTGGSIGTSQDVKKFLTPLSTEIIPTPRSLRNLFNQPETQGSFKNFANELKQNEPRDNGRHIQIACHEYLWTIVQALRWESGHAYWQLLRSAPEGFNKEQLLKTLFYGWDVRRDQSGQYADTPDLERYVKTLIFVYLLRNELLFAPQISEASQRFAPSEQTRSFSEAYVRDQGSKAKAGELYNWAVLMPYAQGVAMYLILIGYPFAALLMLIPGQWKAFYTWVTFFAWVKLWDVGFAIVHVLERSVWSMLGNAGGMARVANMAINTAYDLGTVKAGESCGQTSPLSKLCAVPDVVESGGLTPKQAALYLDKGLIMSGAADLDLTNGYYIYIMAALYFAVPAVTGQLVLGAKAGMASLATQAIGQNAQEAGGAAKTGAVGEANQRIGQVGTAIGQAATAKSFRQSGLASRLFDTQNEALDAGLEGSRLENTQKALGARAGAYRALKDSAGSARGVVDSIVGAGQAAVPGQSGKAGTGEATGMNPAAFLKYGGRLATRVGAVGMDYRGNELTQGALDKEVGSSAQGVDAGWLGSQQAQRGQGLSAYAGRLDKEGDFVAQTAAWEAKNAWGSQISGIAGVYGANPGGLVGQKPLEMTGLALSGNLGRGTEKSARYSGFGFQSNVSAVTRAGIGRNGSQSVLSVWGGGYTGDPGIAKITEEGIRSVPKTVGVGDALMKRWDDAEKNQGNELQSAENVFTKSNPPDEQSTP